MSKLMLQFSINLKIIRCSRCLFTNTKKETTAGIIVIGNEILKGEVIDTNSHFMATALHGWGVKLKKITVIGDSLKDIGKDVVSFSNEYDYVLTTGGIGPTHDDITFEAIATAFNEQMIVHPRLLDMCERFYKTTDPTAPGMKLARVPESAQLNFAKHESGQLIYPNISVRNVYIFPGIPELCRRLFYLVGPDLFQSSNRFHTKHIYFNISEDKLAPLLDSLTKAHPDVVIGSYPELYNSDYKVKVTIESIIEESALKAYFDVMNNVPIDWIVLME